MKILFDLTHPAHINFFKNLIPKLKKKDHEIVIIGIKRTSVMDILRKEYPDFEIIEIGVHGKNKFEIYLKSGIIREFQLFKFLLSKKFDSYVGVIAYQIGLLSKIFGGRSIGVYDDPNHKINFFLSKLILDKFFIPECINIKGKNIQHFKGLKEWAYLSPKYFKPDLDILERYRLKKRSYIFIREVDIRTLNYLNQTSNNIEKLYNGLLNKGQVILSLEDKSKKDIYRNWIILKEPVSDIHSLMYFSKLVISNGDSMAREAAMLGVPALYCGDRKMPANEYLEEKKLLFHKDKIKELQAQIDAITSNSRGDYDNYQQRVRSDLLREWDDINDTLYKEIVSSSP